MSTRNRDEDGTSRGSPDCTDPEVDLEGTPQARRNGAALILWAWRTILVLISVTVLLSIPAFIHDWSQPPEPPAPPAPPLATGSVTPPIGACELRRQAQRRWRAFGERLLRQQLRQTEGAIQGGIEAAFAPVREGIPPFLDWHYSVIGQYVELGQAAFGRLQEELAARLFPGLEGRIADASADVDRVMRDEMRESVEQWIRNEAQTLPTEALRTAYQRMLDATVPATIQRFTVSVVPSSIVAAGAGSAGTAVTAAVAKGLAKKLTASTSVKTVGKAVARIGSPLGAAAAGAAAGTVLGPAGAAIGVLAGATAWLVVDSVFVNVDEHLNRSALERDLIGLVDESEERVKTALSAAVDEAKAEALVALAPVQAIACAEEEAGEEDAPTPLPDVPPFQLK